MKKPNKLIQREELTPGAAFLLAEDGTRRTVGAIVLGSASWLKDTHTRYQMLAAGHDSGPRLTLAQVNRFYCRDLCSQK